MGRTPGSKNKHTKKRAPRTSSTPVAAAASTPVSPPAVLKESDPKRRGPRGPYNKDKTVKRNKKFDKFLEVMIQAFEAEITPDQLKTMIRDNPAFKVQFVKEMFSVLKKYIDQTGPDKPNAMAAQGNFTQNVFVIKGLDDRDDIKMQMLTDANDGDVLDGEFKAVGLDD